MRIIALAVAGIGLAACEDHECTLDSGPQLELRLLPIADVSLDAVAIHGTYVGAELPAFGCGDPSVADTSWNETCRALWVPIADASSSGALAITIEAEGYEPADVTAAVHSDGCHLLPDQVVAVALRATAAFACSSWCEREIACGTVAQGDGDACVEGCLDAIAVDACEGRRAELYLCQAQLGCDDRSLDGGACEAVEDAVADCDA